MIDPRWIGEHLPPAVLPLERGRLLFFAKAIGETDPLYTDVTAARAAGHPDLPAPPTFLFAAELDADAAFWLMARLGVPLARILHGEQGFTYQRLVHAGEILTVRTRIADLYTRKGGALEFLVLESAVEDAQGAPVGSQRSVWVARHPPVEVAEAARRGRASSPGEDVAQRQEGSPVSIPRFADVQLGDPLPELVLPPVSRQTLALFAGASGDHNPIHLDLDFARAAGFPDVFAQGMLGMAWLGRLLTGWLPQGQLREWTVRFTAVTNVGDRLTCRGRVVDKLAPQVTVGGADEARVRVALEMVDAAGEVKIAGEAVVALPVGAP